MSTGVASTSSRHPTDEQDSHNFPVSQSSIVSISCLFSHFNALFQLCLFEPGLRASFIPSLASSPRVSLFIELLSDPQPQGVLLWTGIPHTSPLAFEPHHILRLVVCGERRCLCSPSASSARTPPSLRVCCPCPLGHHGAQLRGWQDQHLVRPHSPGHRMSTAQRPAHVAELEWRPGMRPPAHVFHRRAAEAPDPPGQARSASRGAGEPQARPVRVWAGVRWPQWTLRVSSLRVSGLSLPQGTRQPHGRCMCRLDRWQLGPARQKEEETRASTQAAP